MRLNLKSKLLTSLAACTLLIACSDEVLNEPSELQDVDSQFELDVRWTESVGDGAGEKYSDLMPAVWNEMIITADVAGLVTAFDRESGDIEWEVDLKLPLSGGVTANAGIIVIGTKKAQVIALNVDDGSELWRTDVSSEVLAKPAIESTKVIVRTADGRIFALDITDGEQEWFYDRVIPNLTIRGTAAPLATNGYVLTGFANGKMVAFNQESGDMLWEQRISSPRGSSEISRIVDVDTTPVVFGTTLYAAGYNGYAIAMDLSNGRFLWREELSTVKDLLVDSLRMYSVTNDGTVVALNRLTGEVSWKQEGLKYRSPTAAADFGDYIVVGDFEGYVHFLDKSTGQFVARDHLDDYGFAHQPVVTDDELIMVSRFGFMYVINQLEEDSKE
ncbi:outer membrane protein assembly factor BamB [Kangiella sediminilitoris]|uniref:Outer membrane protein assembly factor BamB n=1 Tax=Kangiella sediminilitoris TaxID=1144748 RepID=A0A1B3BBX8_9GAMM|nr:outer membrane protein assembly factor BamB [Kangiella sediminilitoris]AOE50291.1 Outer membrane protein assembly factor BamB [Kangiella sediminilitoris]